MAEPMTDQDDCRTEEDTEDEHRETDSEDKDPRRHRANGCLNGYTSSELFPIKAVRHRIFVDRIKEARKVDFGSSSMSSLSVPSGAYTGVNWHKTRSGEFVANRLH